MEKLLTLKDVLAMCGVKYSTINRWRKNEEFPAPVGCGKLLWTQSTIQQWLDRKATPVTSTAPPTKQRQNKKAFEKRQAAADAVIQKHATEQ